MSQTSSNAITAEHLEDLQKSGLSEELITQAGLYSLTKPSEIESALGFTAYGVKSALVFPYSPSYKRLKLFPPIVTKEGDTLKYLQRKDSGNHLYFPPGMEDKIKNPNVTLCVVEGEKKTLKAAQEGISCVGIGGIWNWIDSDTDKPIKEFLSISPLNRKMELVPDSDFVIKDGVKLGIFRLGKGLEGMGASVLVVCLPNDGSDGKTGLDDYLLNHSIEEFNALPRVDLKHNLFKGCKVKKKQNKNSANLKKLGETGTDKNDCFQSKDPNVIARAFYQDVKGVYHWRSDFYLWDGNFWKGVSTEDIQSKLGTWLEQKKFINNQGKPEPFHPSSHDVNEVREALARLFHLADVNEAPFWIDPKSNDPRPTDLIPFRNGVLNLVTFQLQDPTPRLFSLNKVDCNYDPSATCPTWDEFMTGIFPEDNDERIGCVEEMGGYCLTDDTSQQKGFLCVGVRRSGKGTIGRVLRRLIGANRWSGPTVSSFSNDFGLQQFIGKSVAMIADARGQSRHDPHVLVERILTITGEDPQSINRKHKDHWDGILPTRLIYSSNVPPKFLDPSGTIVTRFIAIPFTVSFEGKEDTKLTDKLFGELPGIVNRFIEGLKRLRERGHFKQPKCGQDLLGVMDDSTGPVKNFVNDMCVIGPKLEIKTETLYNAFCYWLDRNGHHRMSQPTFGSDLFALDMGIKKSNKRVGDDRERYYTGIKLLTLVPPKGSPQKTTGNSPLEASQEIELKRAAIEQAEQLLKACDERLN